MEVRGGAARAVSPHNFAGEARNGWSGAAVQSMCEVDRRAASLQIAPGLDIEPRMAGALLLRGGWQPEVSGDTLFRLCQPKPGPHSTLGCRVKARSSHGRTRRGVGLAGRHNTLARRVAEGM